MAGPRLSFCCQTVERMFELCLGSAMLPAQPCRPCVWGPRGTLNSGKWILVWADLLLSKNTQFHLSQDLTFFKMMGSAHELIIKLENIS